MHILNSKIANLMYLWRNIVFIRAKVTTVLLFKNQRRYFTKSVIVFQNPATKPKRLELGKNYRRTLNFAEYINPKLKRIWKCIIGSQVKVILNGGLKIGWFCLLVELAGARSATLYRFIATI